MGKPAVRLSFEQVEKAVETLLPEQQQKLSNRLWLIRMERLAGEMRTAARKNRLTQKELKQVCEQARETVYQKRCR